MSTNSNIGSVATLATEAAIPYFTFMRFVCTHFFNNSKRNWISKRILITLGNFTF